MGKAVAVDGVGGEAKWGTWWWRSAPEFDDNGDMKIDVSHISDLTPRLKLLREMERLARISPDGFDDLRHKLLAYHAGDLYLPTGGIPKEKMGIPRVITILLLGFHGTGKSSLINLMYSIFGRAGLIPFAQTSQDAENYSTMFLEEHNVLRSAKNGFCVFDSRGLDYEHVEEGLEGVNEWMEDGVRHHQECWRPSDGRLRRVDLGLPLLESPKYVKRRVNCAMVVVSVAELYRALKAGNLKPLEATKKLFYLTALKRCNENPILILTHGDELLTEERLEGRLKICEYLGISESTGAYDIVCLTEYGFVADETDPISAYTLTEAVYRALLFSDRTHIPKRSVEDWLLHFLYKFMCCMAALCAFLANLFSKLAKKANDHKLKR